MELMIKRRPLGTDFYYLAIVYAYFNNPESAICGQFLSAHPWRLMLDTTGFNCLDIAQVRNILGLMIMSSYDHVRLVSALDRLNYLLYAVRKRIA